MMTGTEFKLANPPIMEAVLDIECDLPPGQQFAALEAPARDSYRASYPKFRAQFLQQHQFESKPGETPKLASVRQSVQAFQFLKDDEKQIVQVRSHGFSFNRLSPYTSLDDMLPEIEAAWGLYTKLVSPVQIRLIRLRYINRILLPMAAGRVELNDYFTIGPRLPDEKTMALAGFLNQYVAVEVGTNHQINIVLTMQPADGDRLPIIFDNCVAAAEPHEPEDWAWILAKVTLLRSLKNRIFRETVTQECLNLFQQR